MLGAGGDQVLVAMSCPADVAADAPLSLLSSDDILVNDCSAGRFVQEHSCCASLKVSFGKPRSPRSREYCLRALHRTSSCSFRRHDLSIIKYRLWLSALSWHTPTAAQVCFQRFATADCKSPCRLLSAAGTRTIATGISESPSRMTWTTPCKVTVPTGRGAIVIRALLPKRFCTFHDAKHSASLAASPL